MALPPENRLRLVSPWEQSELRFCTLSQNGTSNGVKVDGELLFVPRGSDSDSLAVWSNQMRKRHFPNPVPDSYFTGNATKHPEAGLLQDYYAWEWGDALFVVLDLFWFTQKQRGQFCGYFGFLVQPVLSSLPVIDPLAASP